jgi:hypothetical protein
MTVYYTDDTYSNVTKDEAQGTFAISKSNKVIHNIVLEGGTTVITGRKADGSAISLKFSEGSLAFRDAVDGYIPVGTYSELQMINYNSTNRAGTYRQEADIDLINEEWTPIGNSGSNNRFTGTFDGDNHTIARLKITGNNDNAGLFGYIDGSAVLRKIHIISGSVSGNGYVGSICGRNVYSSSSLISSCSNAASVSGTSYVGGICGFNYSSIADCSNTGSVSGTLYGIGGVCGYNQSVASSASITDCSNTGSVAGEAQVGGVCGYNYTSSPSSSYITACYNTGTVSGTSDLGGVCGYNYIPSSYPYSPSSSYITACYNTGTVSGSSTYIGGVCGRDEYTDYYYSPSSYITACYNTGTVSGCYTGTASGYGHVGGVCGYPSNRLTITACYNIGSVSLGGHSAGGVCGSNDGTITACYWKDVPDDDANYGLNGSSGETTIFTLPSWPSASINAQWGVGDGSGDGKYWKSLGGWNGGNPIYPKLFYEE